MRFCARCDNCRWFCEASAAPTCDRISSQRGWAPPTEAALVFHMLCMFGQLSPLLGDLKIRLLRLGIACSRRHSFGFFGSLPVFFRSFHADALWSLNEFRTPLTLNQDTGLGIRTVPPFPDDYKPPETAEAAN